VPNKLRREKILSDYEGIYAKMCQEGEPSNRESMYVKYLVRDNVPGGHCVKLVKRENIPGGEYVKFLKRDKMPKMQ
jgi:hypothetical protein